MFADSNATGAGAALTAAAAVSPAARDDITRDGAAVAEEGVAAASQPPKTTRARSSNLTHEQKRLICIHAKQHPTLTQAQLGLWAQERFALATVPSQSSISHTLKRKANFEHMKSEELASKRMRSVKFPELDVALANWFLYCQARQVKLQGDEVKAKAHLLFEMMGISAADPPQFSNGWLHSFQSRHGFSRSPTSANSGRGSGSNALGGDSPLITTRSELFAAVEGVAPWDLYWMDETKLLFTMSPDRDAALSTGDESDSDKKMTLALCTNADGSDMLDPFFICSRRLENASSASVGFQYAYNRRTWMTPTVFREWLLALDWKMHEESRQVVLLLDSYSSHQVKKLALKNVSVRFYASSLSPPSSHLLEGESLFGSLESEIFTALKRRYRHVFLDHVLDRRDERHEDIYAVDPLQAVQWVVRCWRQVPKALIARSFASIGVHVQETATVAGGGENAVEMAQGEEKLDAQITTLLKRLKLKSPMQLDEFLSPAAESVVDEELSDQDFVDSALNAALGVAVTGSEAQAPRRAPRGRSSVKKSAGVQAIPGSAAASQQQQLVTPGRGTSVAASDSSVQASGGQGSAASTGAAASTIVAAVADEEWQAWANSQRVKTASDDFQALQRVIRLAAEMNCETATMLDLNRMLLEVTQAHAVAPSAQDPPASESLQSTGVCRFTFGATSKHVV